MPKEATLTNVEEMLALTRQALDEFESVPLAASLRRVERIARLRGDIHYAHMFQLDLRPTGGSTTWSRTEAYELLKSEEVNSVDVDTWRSYIFEEWIKERSPSKVEEPLKGTFGDDHLIAGSIESVIRHSALMERGSARAPNPQLEYQMELRRELDLEVIERTTHRVFTYLCTVERDLSYVGVNADIFERHRRRVESFLSQISPQVLEQFTAAYRRAREDDAESKTHALTTCRRILESVADVVYPARAQPVVDSGGTTRNVGPEAYVNRLWMFVADSMSGSTQSKVLLTTLQDFGSRIDKVYLLTNKGVHAAVTQAEVDTCVMQTYLLAGEILRIFEDTSKGDPAE
ncbi:MAG TPA: hypothetical protein VGL69_04140 [Solirubrobacteraceae bacterium]|jgi:hypothetical protein